MANKSKRDRDYEVTTPLLEELIDHLFNKKSGRSHEQILAEEKLTPSQRKLFLKRIDDMMARVDELLKAVLREFRKDAAKRRKKKKSRK